MRYLALIMMVVTASLSLPEVTMPMAEPARAVADIGVSLDIADQLSEPKIEHLQFVVASFEAPKRGARGALASVAAADPLPARLSPPLTQLVLPKASLASPAAAAPAVLVPAAHVDAPDPETVAMARAAAAFAPEAPAGAAVFDAPDPETAPPATAETGADVRSVSATWLNMRAGPSKRFPVVSVLSNGDRATVIGEGRGSWVQILSAEGAQQGWVVGRFLGPVDDDA